MRRMRMDFLFIVNGKFSSILLNLKFNKYSQELIKRLSVSGIVKIQDRQEIFQNVVRDRSTSSTSLKIGNSWQRGRGGPRPAAYFLTCSGDIENVF